MCVDGAKYSSLLFGSGAAVRAYGAVKWSKYHFKDVVHEINGIR